MLESTVYPPIGFGTGQLEGAKALDAVSAALQTGYRLIDTGARYGNETEVGQAIARSGIARSKIRVMTKGAHDVHEHGYQTVLDQFQESLGRLALKKVDYYLVHWPADPEKRLDTWRAMTEIKQSGRATRVGVCNYAVHHLEEIQNEPVRPAVNQIEFHPYIFAEQQPILKYCREHRIAIVGYATFADGQADTDQTVLQIADRYHKTPRQVLTRWSIQHGVIPLVRSGNPDHIAQNFAINDFFLSNAEVAVLDGLHGTRGFPDPNQLP